MEPGSIDLVLCDVPYGIDFQSNRPKDKTRRKPRIANDKQPFLAPIPFLKTLVKNTGGAFLFTRWDVQQAYIDALDEAGMPVRSAIIWDKQTHGMGDLRRAYGSRYETILWSPGRDFAFPDKRPEDIIACPRVSSDKLQHPNEKPVMLLEKLILQTTKPGAVVLDFCMGSGSTGVACVNTGREFVGIELDASHYTTACRRIEEAANLIHIAQ